MSANGNSTTNREHPLITSARREAIVALLIWLAALSYSVGYCCLNGYGRKPESLTFVLGFPDWVFWGLIVPWGVCTIVSGWFAFAFMKDENLETAEDRSA
jgi:hypothetical protein